MHNSIRKYTVRYSSTLVWFNCNVWTMGAAHLMKYFDRLIPELDNTR
jgi:hypothetical protein